MASCRTAGGHVLAVEIDSPSPRDAQIELCRQTRTISSGGVNRPRAESGQGDRPIRGAISRWKNPRRPANSLATLLLPAPAGPSMATIMAFILLGLVVQKSYDEPHRPPAAIRFSSIRVAYIVPRRGFFSNRLSASRRFRHIMERHGAPILEFWGGPLDGTSVAGRAHQTRGGPPLLRANAPKRSASIFAPLRSTP